ncbi:MAG: cytochrome c, partial [Gammaproteobacteria bacterium]|nr:cytochrome c [Gammaproteobacteria bacterium]
MCNPFATTCWRRGARSASITTIASRVGAWTTAGRSIMSTSRNAATFGRILALLLLAGWVAPVGSQETRIQLGTPISEDQLSGFDLIAAPDGSGMPPGAGTARQGREVYELNCLRCHNVNGEGVSGNTVIAGGDMRSEESPLRTVGSFWPHASTLFDFIRRAMPADMPKTLTDEEAYQVTAYVLFLNGIIGEDESINSETLTAIAMPNGNGFVDQSHL